MQVYFNTSITASLPSPLPHLPPFPQQHRYSSITVLSSFPMSAETQDCRLSEEPKCRPVGGTEYSWCRAVPGGTGVTVLALLLTKPPQLPLLQSSLHNLLRTHPILRSKLRFTAAGNSFSFLTPSDTTPPQIEPFSLTSTSQVIESRSNSDSDSVPPFQIILEHEMSRNPWVYGEGDSEMDVFFASSYTLPGEKWALMLRMHTAACDRAAAVSVLRELLDLMGGGGGGEKGGAGDVGLAIEDCVPSGKANKPFWARGMDMIGYSANSFRLANLDFKDTRLPRYTEYIRLKMNLDETDRILAGCKSRGIRLFGLLAAAGLIAARASKSIPDEKWEKYSVATLINCRSLLDPVLSEHDIGFYHSAIINSHDIKGGEDLWELAGRTYTSLSNAKKNNKHFTDMADLNFLMCKAIENPGLTPSSSMRTSVISVFEDSVIDHSNQLYKEVGLEDFIGCASVHGVSPSLAIFDTIRDGELDCHCVYPAPLHSREQMKDLVDHMKKILVDGCK